jgi:hypothetical protein
MSLTGSNADNRILIKPSEMGAAIVRLVQRSGNPRGGSGGNPKVNERAAAAIKKVAADLVANAAGKSLVVCGSNNVMEQVIVNKINDLLGNEYTIDFSVLQPASGRRTRFGPVAGRNERRPGV